MYVQSYIYYIIKLYSNSIKYPRPPSSPSSPPPYTQSARIHEYARILDKSPDWCGFFFANISVSCRALPPSSTRRRRYSHIQCGGSFTFYPLRHIVSGNSILLLCFHTQTRTHFLQFFRHSFHLYSSTEVRIPHAQCSCAAHTTVLVIVSVFPSLLHFLGILLCSTQLLLELTCALWWASVVIRCTAISNISIFLQYQSESGQTTGVEFHAEFSTKSDDVWNHPEAKIKLNYSFHIRQRLVIIVDN